MQALRKTSVQAASRPVASSSRCAPVVCRASKTEQMGLAAATFAAGVMLSLAPAAEAGVQYAKPELKRFGEAPPAKKVEAAAPKETKRGEAINLGKDPLDVRVLALPGALGAIGAAVFAYSKVDDEFLEWFDRSGAAVRDCNNYVGFEDEIKSSYVYQADGVFPSKGGGGGKKKAAPKSGTVKGTKTTKGTQKGGGGGTGFKLPFGK